jgi:cation transport regulator ChaC
METASLIASGKGVLGTNREYLVQLATQLDALVSRTPMSHSSTPDLRHAGYVMQSTRGRFQTMLSAVSARPRHPDASAGAE